MGRSVDVEDLIDDFRVDGGVKVERRTSPTIDVRGEAVAESVKIRTLERVAVHPMSERELKREADSDRRTEGIRVVTDERLRTSGDGFVPDVVRYDSKRYEVTKVADYDRQGGVFMATGMLAEAVPA